MVAQCLLVVMYSGLAEVIVGYYRLSVVVVGYCVYRLLLSSLYFVTKIYNNH